MNERIKELANKAGYNDQIYEISKQGLEKFAELIVQECAKITEEPGHIGRRDLDWRLVFNDYFGIK